MSDARQCDARINEDYENFLEKQPLTVTPFIQLLKLVSSVRI